MIRKFETVSGLRIVGALFLAILSGAATLHAQQPAQSQQPPAQQTQDSQQSGNPQSGGQEASPEETTAARKTRPKEYTNWTFGVGGGASLTAGTTNKFARGGGGVVGASVARNGSKYLGLRADFQFDDLPLRNTALQLAQAPSATSHAYTFMFGPIINVPVDKTWGGYFAFGAAYIHRTGTLASSTAIPGSPCNAFFAWWGTCYNVGLPVNGKFLKSSQSEVGEDFAVGITRAIRPHMDLYAEFRILHGSKNGTTTDVRPITVGIRW